MDDALVKNRFQAEEDLFEMNNGCICCTVRVDLITILMKLMKRKQDGGELDHIVIETTGLADPAPVAQTFFVDDNVKSFARLDAIVTLVDALHIEAHLDEEKPEGVENEAVEQVARQASPFSRHHGMLQGAFATQPVVKATESRRTAPRFLGRLRTE